MKTEFAGSEDAAGLLAVYAPYVEDTAVTFEYEVPSMEEFRQRISDISAKYPYIKAVGDDGSILGYAYAGTFNPRRAYDWSGETTVYVRRDDRHHGVGRALYEKLEELLRGMGILNMNACIASPKCEDPYLTDDSIRFHHRMGFTDVGLFHDSGYKFGHWYDMIWMEKMIGEHTDDQKAVSFGAYRNK